MRTGKPVIWILLAGLLGCERPSATTVAPEPGDGHSSQADPDPAPAPEPVTLSPELEQIAALIGRRQHDEARGRLAAYREAHPGDGRAVFLEGLVLHEQQAYARARPLFERALELSPGFAVVHHFLGWCLYNLGELDGAARHFELHLNSDPDEGDSHFGLGLVALDRGRLDDAERSFRTALELNEALGATDPARFAARRPDRAKCHARLADVHLAREEPAAARDELLRTIELWPLHYQAYYKLSLAYRRLGEDELADRALADHERVKAQVGR